MYTPYQEQSTSNQYGGQYGQPQQPQQGGLQHPQPQHNYSQGQYQQGQGQYQPQQQHQHQHQQQQQVGGGAPGGVPGGNVYGNFFSDPATAMAALFAKNSFGQSNDYLQQNFGLFIHSTGNVNYYFKVSNSYVIRKVGVILFPYRHKNWTRLTMAQQQPLASVVPGVVPAVAAGGSVYAPPTHDLNAPDLYIPLMSFITYILLWASFQGFKGDFHPQLFGYLASQTLACSIVDISVFKIGLYLLNCSTQSLFWDIIAFSGYKYVTIISLLVWKNVVGGGWIHFGVMLLLTGNLSLFLMRSLKFFVLPSGVDHSSASNSISVGQRRIRIQFLFVYAVVVQFLLVLFMSR